MRAVMAVAVTIVCLVILLELQSLAADEDVKGPKVTEQVCDNNNNNNNNNNVLIERHGVIVAFNTCDWVWIIYPWLWGCL